MRENCAKYLFDSINIEI